MTPSDNQIMTAVADGELGQLSELYRRYRDPLFGFLVNRCRGDRTTAEDLLHTVFERIIRYRSSYRGEGGFRSWAFTIARNVHADHCRQSGRLPLRDGVEVNELNLTANSILTDWIRREEFDQCLAALAALTPTYREVVELAWRRKMKYADIAAVLGTTESNVKVRMHRACKQLRANYQKMDR